jgi:hypothetical protein
LAISRRSSKPDRRRRRILRRITPKSLNEDERAVHRQALAGMLWSKQYYYFDLDRWLQEHRSHPLMESAGPACGTRNGFTC